MKKLKEINGLDKLMEYFEYKYKDDFYNIGYCRIEDDERENDIFEKLIMKYHKNKTSSEYFIKEICFIHRIINKISLRNQILCQSFGDDHIWYREGIVEEAIYLNN